MADDREKSDDELEDPSDTSKWPDWERMQERAFAGWVENNLAKVGAHLEPAKPLNIQFQSGILLIKLAECLLNAPAPSKYKPTPKMRVHQIENVNIGLNMLRDHGLWFTASAEDIVDGHKNKAQVLGLVWEVFSNFVISGVEETKNGADEDALLSWLKGRCDKYAGVSIQNYTTAWQNGLAFNALLHSEEPSLINFGALVPDSAVMNLTQAFRVANERFNIPPLLDPQDMVKSTPDAKAVKMYLTLFYVAFAEKKKQDEAVQRTKMSGQELYNDLLKRYETVVAERDDLRKRLESVETERDNLLAECSYTKNELDTLRKSSAEKIADMEARFKKEEADLQDQIKVALADVESLQTRLGSEEDKSKTEIELLRAQLENSMRSAATELHETKQFLEGSLEAEAVAHKKRIDDLQKKMLDLIRSHKEELAAARQLRDEEKKINHAKTEKMAAQIASEEAKSRKLEATVGRFVRALHNIHDNIPQDPQLAVALYNERITLNRLDSIIRDGWLRYRKKKRWCVLSDMFLFVFRDKEATSTPLILHRVNDTTLKLEPESMSFTLIYPLSKDSDLTFSAFSEVDFNGWVKDIQHQADFWRREGTEHIEFAVDRQNIINDMVDPRVVAQPHVYRTRLLEAVEADDSVEARKLLRMGVDANAGDAAGIRPIHVAAKTGKLKAVHALLEYGAQWDIKNEKGETPVQLATKAGHKDIAQLLTERGSSEGGMMTKVEIQLMSATDLAARNRNGFADPYVKFMMADTTVKSKTQYKTLNPLWENEKCVLPLVKGANEIKVEVWNWNKIGRDDFMGGAVLPVPAEPAPQEINLELKNTESGHVHIKVALK